MKPTDTAEFFDHLTAGTFSEQMGRALSDVAAGVIDHGKKGKVIITLEMRQIGQSNQVKISHKLDYTQPTQCGSKREDTTQETPMYVTPNGVRPYPRPPNLDMFRPEPVPAHD